MAEKNFNIVPTVSISRSKFLRRSQHKTSMKLGDIVPIYVDEVLPGDTRSLDIASLIRMSTPIAPIMDDIVMEFYAFFVPNRLVWDHWKNFMGERDQSGYGGPEYYIPTGKPNFSQILPGTIGNYLGLPYDSAAQANLEVSLLIPRGYVKIYNRWFRNQNVEGLAPVTTGDTDGNGAASMVTLLQSDCFKAYKKPDYFNTALPYAQKGAPVALPLGQYAPVVTVAESAMDATKLKTNSLLWAESAGGVPSLLKRTDGSGYALGVEGHGTGSSDSGASTFMSVEDPLDITDGHTVFPANLVADLSAATAATINDIRLAFATQKALEKDALYGTRYWEILYGHFGVKSPDASLQDPEYLGGQKVYINVDQVLQATGYSSPSSTTLGTPGANSVTGMKGNLFTKSFCEHGHIFIMAVARQKQHTYGAGINRMWLRRRRFDFYLPVFANLGNQEIKLEELTISSGAMDVTKSSFGFQEAWAEYRYKPSLVSGILNPNLASSLDYWTLADENPGNSVTLSKSYLQESRDNIARALTTGSDGPDFICDFLFNDVAVRPMPMYSIPGLIDHH